MDKDNNGISDSIDAVLRYVAGYICLAGAFIGLTMKADQSVIITFSLAGAGLIDSEKIGKVISNIKK